MFAHSSSKTHYNTSATPPECFCPQFFTNPLGHPTIQGSASGFGEPLRADWSRGKVFAVPDWGKVARFERGEEGVWTHVD